MDEASPTLKRILAQVRELTKAVESAKKSIAGIGAMPALGAAIGEAQRLATAWGEVSKAASSANRAIGRATKRSGALAAAGPNAINDTNALAGAYANLATQMAAARAAGGGWRAGLPPPPRAGGGGASTAAAARGRRLAHGGGAGAHIGGPSVAIPGGSHVNLRGGAAAALGLAGYGAYEAAQMEDAVFQLIYHSGLEQNDTNRSKFRNILQDSMAESGYSLHDIAESAKQEIRMFQGTPGGGIDVLPEMLRAATIESRLKGESPEESMKALIGLAHMTKQYSPEAIKKLAPAFAFLSTANPGSLGSIERAAGYAVPLLQSGLEIDPMQSLLLGTALTRAGATSTKSGTWLREMALRAMPGTSMMSKMAFKKHEESLRELGLVDENHKPTWFTDGKPDLLKMLDIAGANAPKIPLERRAGLERQLFGAQGGGGFALLADPAVREQVLALQKEMNSPEFKNRYAGFAEAYKQGSTVQNARTAIAEFNNTMMDIGAHVLPPLNHALRDFKSVLEGIRGLLPKPPAGGDSTLLGARAMEGAALGAGVGLVTGGPAGAAIGAAGGGVLGTAAGFIEQYNDKFKLGFDKGGTYTSPGKTGKPAEKIVVTPPVNLSINLDGRTVAQVIADKLAEFGRYQTDTAAANGGVVFGP
ncbi:hypothetical protein [Bradyrhizobium guangdongense]|uniref:Phage tail tape measure protein n=1 Tax=Bradyrhizobium guangdongense TaxID=1325090 RepID=A0AA88B878_9BRAD|nr:hypothetical protein [Bradyrhizobium guangdongense]GGI24147.1 hypothetical protein GCM10010987_27930 [Bradyrhizobium guangdongense]